MKLKDKIAIVTGGSQGIGEAIAHAYAKEGATVIITNKNNPEKGKLVANNIQQAGGKAEAIMCDVANESSVNNLIDQIITRYGHIDILVNNAGVLVIKPFEEHTIEDWDYVLNANLKGAFLMSRAVVPYMKKQHYGKIIFVASNAASAGFPNVAPYSASKGGMLAMAKSMVTELAKYNININCISPGNTETPINEEFRSNPEFVKTLAQKTPNGCAYMMPYDIADAAIFLASDGARAVQGIDLIIDNGVCAVL